MVGAEGTAAVWPAGLQGLRRPGAPHDGSGLPRGAPVARQLLVHGFRVVRRGLLRSFAVVRRGLLRSLAVVRRGLLRSLAVVRRGLRGNLAVVRRGLLRCLAVVRCGFLRNLSVVCSGFLRSFIVVKDGLPRGISVVRRRLLLRALGIIRKIPPRGFRVMPTDLRCGGGLASQGRRLPTRGPKQRRRPVGDRRIRKQSLVRRSRSPRKLLVQTDRRLG